MQPPDFKECVDISGTKVTIRTMRPADREMEDTFVSSLSPRSKYLRFHSTFKQLSASMLERFTNVNYPDEMALIATVVASDTEQQIAVARYAKAAQSDQAEVAVVVADAWQRKGLGTRLLLNLKQIAHQAGMKHLEVTVLPDNIQMLTLARKLGFQIETKRHDYQTILLGKDVDDDSCN